MTGDAIAGIDADLQEDISAIGTMADHFRRGCDVVCGVRCQRGTDTVLKRRRAHGETNLNLRGIIPLPVSRSATDEYARQARIASESK